MFSAHVAQAVEHFLGKEEVIGSSPIVGFLTVSTLSIVVASGCPQVSIFCSM